MGDAAEGLIDADSRIQERMEELQRERALKHPSATRDPERLQMLESLRLARTELNRHLSRLEASARHLGFRCRLHDVRGVLQGVSETAERPTKVRVLRQS